MLPQFTQKEGLIEIPLEWERFESYFILFRKEIAASSKSEGLIPGTGTCALHNWSLERLF